MSKYDRDIETIKNLIAERLAFVTYETCGHSGYAAQVCGCDPIPTLWMNNLDGDTVAVVGLWDAEMIWKADQ